MKGDIVWEYLETLGILGILGILGTRETNDRFGKPAMHITEVFSEELLKNIDDRISCINLQ